jgi:hypothetical protein
LASCVFRQNTVPSIHMVSRITASLRATATRARLRPFDLASLLPHPILPVPRSSQTPVSTTQQGA